MPEFSYGIMVGLFGLGARETTCGQFVECREESLVDARVEPPALWKASAEDTPKNITTLNSRH